MNGNNYNNGHSFNKRPREYSNNSAYSYNQDNDSRGSGGGKYQRQYHDSRQHDDHYNANHRDNYYQSGSNSSHDRSTSYDRVASSSYVKNNDDNNDHYGGSAMNYIDDNDSPPDTTDAGNSNEEQRQFRVVDEMKGDGDQEKQIRSFSPPPSEPSKLITSWARALDTASRLEIAKARYKLSCQKLENIQHQITILKDLPIGYVAYKEDLEVSDMYANL